MYCRPDCIDGITLPSIGGNCAPVRREDCPAKLILFRCDVQFPTGSPEAVATALSALMADGTMGATGLLKDFAFGDPTTTDQRFADCTAPETIVTGRDLTFSDYNAYDLGPTGDPSPYYDRQFWRTVMSKPGAWNVGWTTCSGKLYIAQRNGKFMAANITAFQADDRSTEGKCIEVKRGTIRFNGDPLAEFPEPVIDLAQYVDSTPELEALYR